MKRSKNRKPPSHKSPDVGDQVEVFEPEGVRVSDRWSVAVVVSDAHAAIGVHEGDLAVIYHTTDVRPDDLAVVRMGKELWLGTYRTAPGGYCTLNYDGQVTRYKPGSARLMGRVCHVERRGEVVLEFRPIRDERAEEWPDWIPG
jgi:hypothetical protein